MFILEEISGNEIGNPFFSNPNLLDQGHSLIYATNHFVHYDENGRRRPSDKKHSDDQIVTGYSKHGLPYLLVVDGFNHGNAEAVFSFIKQEVLGLVDRYINKLEEKSNSPEEETERLITEVFQSRENFDGNPRFTLSLAVCYERDNLLYCSGFGIGDTGIAIKRNGGDVEQLVYNTKINGFKDAFCAATYDQGVEFGFPGIIARNSTFTVSVEPNEEIVGYTSLHRNLEEECPSPEVPDVEITKYGISNDILSNPGKSLYKTLCLKDEDEHSRSIQEVEDAIENGNYQNIVDERYHDIKFGDDIAIARIILPEIKLQKDIEKYIEKFHAISASEPDLNNELDWDPLLQEHLLLGFIERGETLSALNHFYEYQNIITSTDIFRELGAQILKSEHLESEVRTGAAIAIFQNGFKDPNIQKLLKEAIFEYLYPEEAFSFLKNDTLDDYYFVPSQFFAEVIQSVFNNIQEKMDGEEDLQDAEIQLLNLLENDIKHIFNEISPEELQILCNNELIAPELESHFGCTQIMTLESIIRSPEFFGVNKSGDTFSFESYISKLRKALIAIKDSEYAESQESDDDYYALKNEFIGGLYGESNTPEYGDEFRDEDSIEYSNGRSMFFDFKEEQEQLARILENLDNIGKVNVLYKPINQILTAIHSLEAEEAEIKPEDKALLTEVLRETRNLLENNAFPEEIQAKIMTYESLMEKVGQKSEKNGTFKKVLGGMGMILGGLIFLTAVAALAAFLLMTSPVSVPTIAAVAGTFLASILTAISSAVGLTGSLAGAGVAGFVGVAGFTGGFFVNKKGLEESYKAEQWDEISEAMKEIKGSLELN